MKISPFCIYSGNKRTIKGVMKKKNKKSADIYKARAQRISQAKKKKIREIKKNAIEKARASSYIYAEGRFSGTKSGYGFVTLSDGGSESDIFIPTSKIRGALDGDYVKIKYKKLEGGKTEGEVTEISENFRDTVIGTLSQRVSGFYRRKQKTEYVVIPDDKRLSLEIRVEPSRYDKLGDKVEVLLPKRRQTSFEEGEIIRNFGSSDTKEANYEAILAEVGIPTEFSPEALSEANAVASEPLSEEGRKRLDREIIFTIDGADAKDLDDAISLSRLAGGRWMLGVHIADVSHYVRAKTPLDRTAMERGTSVYFVDKVVPMLPQVLSNGACSLNPNEDKYALSAHMILSENGNIESCRVEKTIIRSRVRGVYSEVNSLLEAGKESPFYSKYREVYPTLLKMYELYKILDEKNTKNGALELETAEARISLNENGTPVKIEKAERGDAEKLIEAFMLTANEAVAALLTENEYPCVYRIHEPPPPDKLDNFRTYSANLGLNTAKINGEAPSAADLSSVLREANEKGIGYALSTVLLRTMSKARYSEIHLPHYGLGIDLYCHFTSPIRRLSDLATHRMIKAVLIDGEDAKKYRSYAKRAAVAASDCELRALNAERQIEALYKTVYMSSFIGEKFTSVVTSVTKFGLFVELENTCEGLIPTSELGGYYIYDDVYKTLSNGSVTHRIGDRLTVRVENADIASRTVNFSIVE